ncbi:MAG: single-stranded DNA-binding protein [Phycisphaerae bacterium]|nr:single-stranded DNA-binding protein [Phycisphaerae bacterium]
MASYNKVILMGNLTRDPQLSYLPSQTPVCEIGLAVNHRWRSQDGQQREEVCFIDARSFGKQAEVLNQYMRKGQPLLIEGRLQFDQWESQDGQKRSKHRVFIERFSFVGGGQQTGGPQNQGGGYAPAPPMQNQPAPPMGVSQAPPMNMAPPPPNVYDESGGEDIPF